MHIRGLQKLIMKNLCIGVEDVCIEVFVLICIFFCESFEIPSIHWDPFQAVRWMNLEEACHKTTHTAHTARLHVEQTVKSLKY